METTKERPTTWQPLVMHLNPVLELDEDTFFHIAQLNKDLRLELTAERDLIVMPPAGGNTSIRNSALTFHFESWNRQHKRGTVFESSGGFRLPNGAIRSPDVSWVSKERLAELTQAQMDKFLPLCPEFVLELRSPTDRLEVVREKMQEYMENGAELGWLIDPQERRVYIYTSEEVEELERPQKVVGKGVLEGFVLELDEIW